MQFRNLIFLKLLYVESNSENSAKQYYNNIFERSKTVQLGFTIIGQSFGVNVEIYQPENRKKDLVTLFQNNDYCVLFIGSLYYQHELLTTLKPNLSAERLNECKSNIAALVLTTYLHLGATFLEKLEGDFSLVIWDSKKTQLIAMRDPMGGYPLFWIQLKDRVAFSTSIWRLLDLLPQKSLQLEYLADFLAISGQRNEGATEQCVYQDIHRVRAGTIVSADVLTCQIVRKNYWDWSQHISEPNSHNVSEMIAQYADVLHSAVRERLQGKVLAHLSGGMDSTSVALIARDEIRAGFAEKPLHTLSLVYENLPFLTRERPYIEAVLQNQTEFVAHRLVADELLDFDSFIAPPLHDEPYAGLWRLAMDTATVEAAANIDAVTMLTGMGADDIHEMHPYDLNDLLREGKLIEAWREAIKWAKVRNCNVWNVLKPFGIDPLVNAWLPWLSSGNFLQKSLTLKEQNDLTVPPWIRQDFVKQYALASRIQKNTSQVYFLCQQASLSVMISGLMSRAGEVLRWSVAAPLGIAIAHPFLDSRVLALGLGIRQKIPAYPGKMKPILAEAMGELLPPKITERKRKGHFNEVYYLGLAKNVDYLEEMIEKAPIDELKIFDKPILRQAVREASLGTADARQLQRLDLSLCLIKWLSMQEQWQKIRTPIDKAIFIPINQN